MGGNLVKQIEALGKLKRRLRCKGSPAFFSIKRQHKQLKKKLALLSGETE